MKSETMNLHTLTSTIVSLLIVSLASISSAEPASDLQPHNQPPFQGQHHNPIARAKRMFALCPPSFVKIGSECYYISSSKVSWLDAHFECKDKNAKLAEPMKFADRRLRKYLSRKDQSGGAKWIGDDRCLACAS